MKKKFIFMTMIAVLMTALVAPATVAAAGPKSGTEFYATGDVSIAGIQMYREIINGNGTMISIAVHESLTGSIAANVEGLEWEDIDGATFSSTHTGVVQFTEIGITGSIAGSFTLDAGNGDTISGHMQAKIIGYSVVTGEIIDQGTFQIDNGTGIFEKIKGSGTITAYINPDTFGGHIEMSGQYRYR